jgi:hypothetical protein
MERNTEASMRTEVRILSLLPSSELMTLAMATGKHALGDRARKLDQGILITRFELPFNIWW